MGLARDARILKDGELFVVSDERGDLRRTFPGAGLYARDTRFLSELWLLLNGEEPELFDSSAERTASAVFEFGNTVFRDDDGRDVLAHTIALRRYRTVRHGRLEEELVLDNFNPFPVSLELALVFAADFLDIFEVRGFPRERPRGRILLPRHTGPQLLLAYRAPDDVLLETEIAFDRPPDLVTTEAGTTHLTDLALPRMLLPGHDQLIRAAGTLHPPRAFALFRLTLAARGRERLTFRVSPRHLLERHVTIRIPDVSQLTERTPVTSIAFARVRTNHAFLDRILQRSLDDIRALLTPFPGGRLVAAGVPWFVAPFGRDSLIVSLQMMLFAPQLALETLRFLARYQGRKSDPWTEEEPGKILHELRFGEMVRLGETPHSPYYGTVDATPLFVVTFCELMNWVGTPALFDELFPAVEAALDWIDRYADHDRDGFIDYGKVSPRGLEHQNWKDSHNALLFPDGGEPVPPIAPVEVQGYVFQAKRMLAAVLHRFGGSSAQMLAARLRAEAEQLRERFERRFWSESDRFYGQALDGQGRLV
ncbi:MAG: amylo-alpha-1,6-glucosidase, partial [Thermomicrobium sp.]|nr:amylo-alpha-1,6-glucosidase [Thermomicrobium sp.]